LNDYLQKQKKNRKKQQIEKSKQEQEESEINQIKLTKENADNACAYFYQLSAEVRSSFATLKVDALPTKFLLRSARL
jgi:hypothetical protein